MKTFEELVLDHNIVTAIKELGFQSPMSVQGKVIPVLLDNNKTDVIVMAQTGTSKTANYGLPIIQNVKTKNHTQFLILSPTRELCLQIADDLSQAQREVVVNKIRHKNIRLLIAIDVAASGFDVDNLTHVINYNLPDELEVYTNRSGSTGRTVMTGTSIVITNLKEKSKLLLIKNRLTKNSSINKFQPVMKFVQNNISSC